MSDWAGIVWLVVLLVVNAFFVGVGVRRHLRTPLADRAPRREGQPPRQDRALGDGARHAHAGRLPARHHRVLARDPERLRARDPPPARGSARTSPGWSEEVIGTVAFIIALVIVTYLHVVLGEMVPKNLSFTAPDKAVLLLATAAGLHRPHLPSRDRRAERHRERIAAPARRRAEVRGEQHVHPRGGRDDRQPVQARGRAQGLERRPERGVRVHHEEGAGRRGAAGRGGQPPRDAHADRRSSAPSPSTASRATS